MMSDQEFLVRRAIEMFPDAVNFVATHSYSVERGHTYSLSASGDSPENLVGVGTSWDDCWNNLLKWRNIKSAEIQARH
jgi:hypothetical protein